MSGHRPKVGRERIRLTVNETKTHRVRVPDESFDFLGYTFGRLYSPRTGNAYIGCRPAKRKVQSICREVSKLAGRHTRHLDTEEQVGRLNRMLRGWANYFSQGTVKPACNAVDSHTRRRLRRWLCKKHKIKGRGLKRFPDLHLIHQLGLLQLGTRHTNDPCAKT